MELVNATPILTDIGMVQLVGITMGALLDNIKM